MAIIQISKIQVRTGANVDLPQLDVGEIGYATDTHQLYIGNDPNIDPPVGLIPSVTEIVTKGSSAGANLGYIGNVKITGGSSGQAITTDGTGNLSFTTVAIYSNSNVASYLPTYQGNINAGNVTIQGNLTVTGTTTTTNQATLSVTDHNIILNAGTVGTPSFNAALVVARGSSANTSIRWNEGSKLWEQTRDGSNYFALPINTTELAEGSNLYFTTARANSAISNYLPFNTSNIAAGNASLGNTATANFFIGNGSFLTGLPTTYTDSDVANYLPLNTANISAGNASLGNAVVANYFVGNLYGVANVANIANVANAVAGPNVSGQVPNSLIAGTVYTGAQPNITSVGTLVSLTITNSGSGNLISDNANLGNAVRGNYFIGAGNNLSNIRGANVSGQVPNSLVSGTVYTSAQPNITSVGTLTSLTVTNTGLTGNIIVDNANVTFLLSATYLAGDGSNLSNINGSNVIGTVGNATHATVSNSSNRVAWGNITGAPTTISGYGITDAYSNTNAGSYLTSYTGNLTANVANITTGNISNLYSAHSNLGSNANIKITGGNNGQVLATDGTGNLIWVNSITTLIEAPFISKTIDFVANVGGRYGVNTSSAQVTAILPSSPSVGDAVYFMDFGGAYATHHLVVSYTGSQTIMGLAEDMVVSINGQSFGLAWNGSTWRIY